MPSVTLVDVRLLSGGYEVSSDHNAGKLTRGREVKDASTFGNRNRVYRPGLKLASLNLNGYFDETPSAVHQSQHVATTPDVMTVVLPDGTEGAVGYSMESVVSDLNDFGGSIGDMAAFAVTAQGSGDNFRGTVLEDGNTVRSASGTGTAYLLTDVTSGEVMRAAIHVIGQTGTAAVTARIESDTSAGFPSATTRLTMSEFTAIGAEYATDATVHADTYYRAAWTVTGTGTVTFVINFGIGNA